MSMTDENHPEKMSTIPVTIETRQLVQGQKRAGWTYDSLLQEMVKQFDSEEVDW